jgi:ribosomal protein S12 methylthiotransferase accessory factor YcaO
LGIPCCKAFVKGIDGSIAKGTSANLDARKAIISAITEVPWPYPSSPESSEGLKDLTIVGYENLPDYSTGNAEGDLKLIEIILAKAGYTPVYVDLTRDDVDLPVVKAIIPGFEWSADFDDYSIISPRFMDKAFS